MKTKSSRSFLHFYMSTQNIKNVDLCILSAYMQARITDNYVDKSYQCPFART